MEHRSLQVAAGLILLLLLPCGTAWAAREAEAGADAAQVADWDRRLARAKAMQRAGSAAHAEATARLESEKKACFKKFRVNDCQGEARQRYVAAVKEARREENEGKALERQVKKERLGDKDARRIEDAPRRAADLEERQAATREERAAAAANREERIADKAAKAEEGEARRRANEARIREKQAKHDRRVAEKMEKARRREAEAGN